MQPSSTARPDTIRRHNLSVMLGHVHRDGALTRAELTQRLAVSRSTVGSLVADLTQLGLVQEVVPSGGAGVGRPSHVVGPHHGGPYVVAVDIDVAHVTVATIGLGGTVLARELMPLPAEHNTPADVVALVRAALPRVRAAGRPTARIAGIGVSVPGTVDRRTGTSASRRTSAGATRHSARCSPRPSRPNCRWRSATTPISPSSPSTAAAVPATATTSST